MLSSFFYVGLDGLTVLNLQDNLLSSVPAPALRQVPSLADLILAGNPLGSIEHRGGAFSHFDSLSSLDLSSCRLSRLGNSAFRGLGTLRRLRMADNNLSAVPSEAFRNVPGLEVLDLGRNPFVSIGPGALNSLLRLKKLQVIKRFLFTFGRKMPNLNMDCCRFPAAAHLRS